jgi:recA bacterial DNA recombination protein
MDRSTPVSEALATLQARWGSAAPRRGGEVGFATEGALARAVQPLELPDADGRTVSTGFAALDAILGTGGLPRSATVALRGSESSGKTTLALRLAAEAQAAGSIVAWLDLARSFDPVDAVARGVRPEWLVVLTPADLEEGLAMSGSLLAARTVDLLVVDLPDGRDPAVAGTRVGDRLGRLAALARRAGTLLVVLEPLSLGRALAAAVEEASGLWLELRPAGWIRLGRDVVGRRSAVTIERNRYGPPGRRADLEILYADGGVRDACLRHETLLDGRLEPAAPPGTLRSLPAGDAAPSPLRATSPDPSITHLNGPSLLPDTDAPAPPALATPAAPPGEEPDGGAVPRRHLRVLAARPDRPRGTALDGRDRGGRGPARTGARRPAGHPARDRAPARARGDLPRPRP